MISNGNILAILVAKGFEKCVGPFGGEDPIVKGNEIILKSQAPGCGYRFNDDGSIDCFYPDDYAMYFFLTEDGGYSEEEAREYLLHPAHYNSLMELVEDETDGWFTYFDFHNQALYRVIKEFYKEIVNG